MLSVPALRLPDSPSRVPAAFPIVAGFGAERGTPCIVLLGFGT